MLRQKVLPHSKRMKQKRVPTVKSCRKMVIGDKIFHYRIGRGGIRIVTPEGKNIRIDMSTFSGWSWEAIERGYWKGYFSVTPKHVREWIEENLLGSLA